MRKSELQWTSRDGSAFYIITSTYTHRCGILRGDPKYNHWSDGNASWVGIPPMGWNDNEAIEEHYQVVTEELLDRS